MVMDIIMIFIHTYVVKFVYWYFCIHLCYSEKDLLLQDLKTSSTDEEKRELQERVEEVEGQIQTFKQMVSMWVSDSTGYEERLGLLKKEGECRTW